MNCLQCALLHLLCCVLFRSGSPCPHGGYNNNQPQFGLGCMYRCHCMNDVQCDYDTGECPRGCAAGWMGPGCQYSDIAFGKTARQQTTYNTNSGAEKAIDGDVSTCSQTTWQYQQWWRVDTGNIYRISELIIISNETDNLNGLEVRLGNYSSDTVADYPIICFKHNSNDSIQTVERVLCQIEVVARHIMIWMPGKWTRLSLCDVKVYGGRSLAYARLTTQSSTDPNQAAASRAVDGETSTNWASQSCTHTSIETAPWWRVDLGRVYNLMRMEIFNRQDCCPERLSGFSVSFATKSVYSISFKYPEETPLRITDITLFSEHMAKEIEIKLLDKTNVLTLCEVFAYGGCLTGLYGVNCDKSCGNCAGNGSCDRHTGFCTHGCATGWLPQKCDIDCLPGWYGVNCSEKCGQCAYATCDRVDGICPFRCADGYNGTKCLTKIPSEVIPNTMDGIIFNGPVIGIITGVSLSALLIGVGFGILLTRIVCRSRHLENTQEDRTYDDINASQAQSNDSSQYAQLEIHTLKTFTPDEGMHNRNDTPKTATSKIK